jgi:septal ring-binding cell division protein DamX
MQIIKTLSILILTATVLLASAKDDIFFVEGANNIQKQTLKDEFLNPKSKAYTLSIATLNLDSTNPYEYFKKNNLKNVLAYKYGKNRKYAKVLFGVFKNQEEAKASINKLPSNIKRNSPYVSKISRQQNFFNKSLKDAQTKSENSNLKKLDELIYISNTKDAKDLKSEFFNENSKYFSLSIATVNLKSNTIKNFFKKNGIEDKGLAHIYGKNRDKARIIYGLYKTRKEATEAIKSLNKALRANKPFAMKMAKFQSFYKKSLPKDLEKEKEKKVIEKKESKKPIEIKHQIGMQMLIEDKNEEEQSVKDKNLEAKSSIYKDLYFFETKKNKHSIKKEFLNDKTTFYTIDFGELDLSEVSIKDFLNKNGLKNNVLAYKYGNKNEYARVLYGAYETREASNDAIEKLNFPDRGLRVISIKNHQILYKIQHNQPIGDKVEMKKSAKDLEEQIFYTQNGKKNILKKEFFDKKTDKYTITLVTLPKKDIELDQFLATNGLDNNTLVYAIGSDNGFYRFLYGVYDNFTKAKDNLKTLNTNLKKNRPYVSKIKTNQEKFESYNDRKIEDYINNASEIKFK